MDLTEEVKAELLTVTGEIIGFYELNKKLNILQLDQIDSGIYYLRLSNGLGTTKLIKL